MDNLTVTHKATILVVDDTPNNLSLMSGLLKDQYKVKIANNGEKALSIAQAESPPDLILLDIMMPGLSGYDVIRALKADPRTREVPVMFITAMSETEDERLGLELGAVDYITKPISPPILLARVATHLKIKRASDFLKDQNAFLEDEVNRRTREVQAIQDVTILAMRNWQPHPPHPALRPPAGQPAADPPALRLLSLGQDHRSVVQVGAAA
jgi:putative two-component system response regulator